MSKEKNLEAILAITLGFLVIYLLGHRPVFLYISVGVAAAGLFSGFLARWIAWLWYKIAHILGEVNSKVILSVVYILILVPLALLYRLFRKDTLQLKPKPGASTFHERNHTYTAKDLENTW